MFLNANGLKHGTQIYVFKIRTYVNAQVGVQIEHNPISHLWMQ